MHAYAHPQPARPPTSQPEVKSAQLHTKPHALSHTALVRPAAVIQTKHGEGGAPVLGLERVRGEVAAGERLLAGQVLLALEHDAAVHGEANGEDAHEARAGEAPRHLRDRERAQRAELHGTFTVGERLMR